jgi:hypothetical protein
LVTARRATASGFAASAHLVQVGLNDVHPPRETRFLLEVAAQVGHRQAGHGQRVGRLVPYPLRQGAKRGNALHAHGGHSHVAQSLEITSAFEYTADGRGEQAQVLFVIVGEPIAVAG